MKTVKIILAAIVISAIVFFVVRSSGGIDERIDSTVLPQNQFVDKIEQEIQGLTLSPEDKFSKDSYKDIVYHIEDYHKNGKFGNNALENAQWKENLSKTAYSAYAEKFVKEAFYVFERTSWIVKDLEFIKSETASLRKSPFLESGSPIDQKLVEIQTILAKYFEITSFIYSCLGYSYSDYTLSKSFPKTESKDKISQATSYLNENLGNQYVNKCQRLHDNLKQVPQILFKAHVRYIDNKINHWLGKYRDYNTQKAYKAMVYDQISLDINDLDNNTYNSSNFDSEYDRLNSKWEDESVQAYNYFNNQNTTKPN